MTQYSYSLECYFHHHYYYQPKVLPGVFPQSWSDAGIQTPMYGSLIVSQRLTKGTFIYHLELFISALCAILDMYTLSIRSIPIFTLCKRKLWPKIFNILSLYPHKWVSTYTQHFTLLC